MSGSMEPAIRVGDVVLTREVPVDQLQPGHVLLVADPASPGHRVMHRFDHRDDDGGLVLRGDANRQEDSRPVSVEHVLGVGVLRVPWVGQPYVWAAEGRYLPVGLTALGLLVLLALSPIRERYEEVAHAGTGDTDDESPSGGADAPAQGSTPAHARAAASAAHAVVALALVAVGTAATIVTTPVSATFTDSVTMTATFATGTWAEPSGRLVSDTTAPAG